jgi:ribosomal protein S27E
MAKLVQLDDVVCLVCAHIQIVFKHVHFVWFLSCEITKLEEFKVSGTKQKLTYTMAVKKERAPEA